MTKHETYQIKEEIKNDKKEKRKKISGILRFTWCVIVMLQSDVLDILLHYNPHTFPYILAAKFAIVIRVKSFQVWRMH